MSRKIIAILGIVAGVALTLVLAATKVDNRHLDMRYPVAKYSATQMTRVAGDANAVSTTLYNINGLIERIDIVSSDANTTGQTYTVALADEDGTALASFATISMDSAVRTMKLATSDSTDFNAVPSNGDIVVTVTGSSAPTGVTWTVNLNIFVE